MFRCSRKLFRPIPTAAQFNAKSLGFIANRRKKRDLCTWDLCLRIISQIVDWC